MKFTNISKFIIKFMGGGKINFPFNNLKEVEINGDNDGEGGGIEQNSRDYFPYWSKPIGFIILGDDFFSNIETDDDGQAFINDDNIVIYPLEDFGPEFVKTNGTYSETVLARVVSAWYEMQILLLYEYVEYTDEYGLEYDSLAIQPAMSQYDAYTYLHVDNGNVDENVIDSFELMQQSYTAPINSIAINGKKYLAPFNYG